MSRIKGRGNKDTEIALAEIFLAHQITNWRRHQAVFGRPDFIFRAVKLAVFVDGCFWHGCPKHGTKPKNNAAFWRIKLEKNIARDRLVTRTLRSKGWRVLRIWEHELLKKNRERLLRRIDKALHPNRARLAGHPADS